MCRTKSIFIFTALLSVFLITSACASIPLKIPFLESVKVDGNPSDWGSSGFRINLFADSKRMSSTSLNCKDTVRLGWSKKGLLALFQVSDSTPHESREITLWQGTSVELLIADHIGGNNCYHLLISPGITPDHPNLRFFFYDNRKDSVLKAIPLTQVSASKATKTGYIIEVLLPWKNLKIKPEIGRQPALQVMINHLDSKGKSSTMMWFPRPGADGGTTLMYPVSLSRETGHDKRFFAFTDGEKIWPENIAVVGDNSLAGRKVTVFSGSHILSQSKMKPASGKSYASLSLPVEKSLQVEEPVTLKVERNGSMTLTRVDAYKNTKHFICGYPLAFSPFVFSGNTFPSCDFEDASQVRGQVGNYTIVCRFFNSDYEEVTTADKPGRYGAIVTIKTSNNGPVVERCVTLFRHDEPIDWRNVQLKGTMEIQDGMQKDFNIGKDDQTVIIDLANLSLPKMFLKSQYGAIIMAGKAEVSAENARPESWNDMLVLDDHWWYGLRNKLKKDNLYQYSAFLPKGYSAGSDKSWPLLIAMHGTGDIEHPEQELLESSAYTQMLKYTSETYPMITVIPHCPEDQMHWAGDMVKNLVDNVSLKYKVDPKRIYLTGYSMGGYGTFSAALEYPEVFAAIAPCCGWSDVEDAARLKQVPVWAFHGDADPLVPWEFSQMMVDAINKVGGNAKLTIYPGLGHSASDPAFADPKLYEWFLSHSK